MNVWLLLIELRIGPSTREKVLGPFTAVAFTADGVIDVLTGVRILRYQSLTDSWQEGDGRTGRFDRVVVQQGSFESPWGERGK